MWRCLISICLLFSSVGAGAQELFMISEPASSVPYKALIARAFTTWYDEMGTVRGMGAFSLDYGLTPRLSLNATIAGSNHHDKNLPSDLVTHRHVGRQTIFYSQGAPRNRSYPFLIKGASFRAKYRFLSKDAHREHFRMAATVMYSTSRSAHDEAEANLIDDNAGLGLGLIATYLKKRVAFSLTYQYLIPQSYSESVPFRNTTLNYGNTQQVNLAIGYLLSPREYENYGQTNTNLYLEVVGKSSQAMEIIQNAVPIGVESPSHRASYYVEVMPGIQKVYNSKTILEFSIGLPLIKQSFAHTTPTYFLSYRRYFFL